jgi:hypothetical protein
VHKREYREKRQACATQHDGDGEEGLQANVQEAKEAKSNPVQKELNAS